MGGLLGPKAPEPAAIIIHWALIVLSFVLIEKKLLFFSNFITF